MVDSRPVTTIIERDEYPREMVHLKDLEMTELSIFGLGEFAIVFVNYLRDTQAITHSPHAGK